MTINRILLFPEDGPSEKQGYKVSWCWGILRLLEQQVWLKAGLQDSGNLVLAMDRSGGSTFFMPQPGDCWCMGTMSNFWHTDFPRVPSRVNQNANAPRYDQTRSLDGNLHGHIDFKTWGKLLSLFNSPRILWLTSLRPLFFGHAHPHRVYIYTYGSADMKTVSRDVLARGRLFAGKQLAALHASSHHISRVAGSFS